MTNTTVKAATIIFGSALAWALIIAAVHWNGQGVVLDEGNDPMPVKEFD